ncbi:hypothetical protein [Jatrophihabitans sp. GAS493]|uniref:hypothetical protein n=1 Tax=Jatrophihabitans sp. GAS493 TaxID=1907575 RepID=UPI000BB8DAF4|nr:hypothetical protein [Jatrophihabitans sp. GAS493]
MALGGAISVDRKLRVQGKSWWPQETLSAADLATASEDGPVDVMVTHDAPAGTRIPGIHEGSDSKWPADAIADSRCHRHQLLQVVADVRPTHVWHGHYHVEYVDTLPWDDGTTTTVHGLDCDDSHWSRHLMIVRTDGAIT